MIATHIIAFVVGYFFGIVLMCLMAVSKDE